MASSSVSKASYHARTVSLPSILHPVAEQLAEKLYRLTSSQSASTSSSSLTNQLNGLKDLYFCVDEFLQLPQNQPRNVEETLDNSLRLLDICTTSRDILINLKEHLQDVQSVIRRKCSGELNITSEATKYLNTRKTAKKAIRKCLQSIKSSETNSDVFSEVEQITIDIFKSLLFNLHGAEMKSTMSRWSVATKLVHHRDEKATSCSAFEALDGALSVICQKKKNNISALQIEDLKTQMVNLELDSQELVETLEALFRLFVKTRASLLNILSN